VVAISNSTSYGFRSVFVVAVNTRRSSRRCSSDQKSSVVELQRVSKTILTLVEEYVIRQLAGTRTDQYSSFNDNCDEKNHDDDV
jgi:hypothetical protein